MKNLKVKSWRFDKEDNLGHTLSSFIKIVTDSVKLLNAWHVKGS